MSLLILTQLINRLKAFAVNPDPTEAAILQAWLDKDGLGRLEDGLLKLVSGPTYQYKHTGPLHVVRPEIDQLDPLYARLIAIQVEDGPEVKDVGVIVTPDMTVWNVKQALQKILDKEPGSQTIYFGDNSDDAVKPADEANFLDSWHELGEPAVTLTFQETFTPP